MMPDAVVVTAVVSAIEPRLRRHLSQTFICFAFNFCLHGKMADGRLVPYQASTSAPITWAHTGGGRPGLGLSSSRRKCTFSFSSFSPWIMDSGRGG